MKIYLVTKNHGKLLAANSVFSKKNIELLQVNKDYLEIQADNSLEIAKHTALEAAKELGSPAIREDHSLHINALGIPGPYMNYFEKRISVKNILKILSSFKDRSGYFEVATVYAEPNGKTKEYSFRIPFQIAKKEKGKLQTGWPRIIVLKSEKKTLAEYPESERVNIWNKNYIKIASYIANSK
ncbi:MAG: non-canonical purine NTP pyrophosphatase [Patescibacteria group bacterium]